MRLIELFGNPVLAEPACVGLFVDIDVCWKRACGRLLIVPIFGPCKFGYEFSMHRLGLLKGNKAIILIIPQLQLQAAEDVEWV